MLNKNVLYYGQPDPLPERQTLRAGPLTMIYENGDLRTIRLGDREIVRRIYVAVRDHNWNTIPARLSNVQVTREAESFAITYTATHQQGVVDFVWQAAIIGSADGFLAFSMNGAARSTFKRNRIGFCILHPIAGLSGTPCQITHADGSIEDTEFPATIAPTLPFRQMTALRFGDHPAVTIRFTGEVFETEDQRNWIDASYKTFGTPLSLPYPVEIAQGTRVRQGIRLTLDPPMREQAATAQADRSANAPASIVLGAPDPHTTNPLPRLGLGVASHGEPLSETAIARLRALHLAQLRVELRLADDIWRTSLRQAAQEADSIGAVLEVALFVSDQAETQFAALRAALETLQLSVCTWLIFHTSEKTTDARWIGMARAALGDYAPAALFGGGTNAYFNELNNNRPEVASLDLISYTINPQVHAFDNASLAETIEAIPDTVKTARSFVGDRLIAISPITLRPRFNVVATAPEPDPPPGQLPRQVDPRQMSLFGVGWTLGAIKALAESGVYSATFYETSGWRGILETEAGSPLPDKFQSIPGGVYPMYHVLADLADFAGGDLLAWPTPNGAPIVAVSVRKDQRMRWLIANLSDESQTIAFDPITDAVLIWLDETTAEDAMRAPEAFRAQPGTAFTGDRLTLRPHAIARLDRDL